MIGLVFALYLAHTLSWTEGEPCEPYFGFFAACLLQPLPCANTANQERRYRLHRTDGRIRNIFRRCHPKKNVPLIVVADKNKADYLVTSSVSHHTPSQPAVVVNNSNVNNTTVNSSDVTNNNGGNDAFDRGFAMGGTQYVNPGSTSASISVIDAHSSQIVFAYAVGKAGSRGNQIQSAAEACAKHLKEFIEKAKK